MRCGVWRELEVARTGLGAVEVAGSNPVAPIFLTNSRISECLMTSDFFITFITLLFFERKDFACEDNLSLYHIFYTVARTGSISHSSRAIFISASLLSASRSRSWSKNPDTVLFKRSSRGAQL